MRIHQPPKGKGKKAERELQRISEAERRLAPRNRLEKALQDLRDKADQA